MTSASPSLGRGDTGATAYPTTVPDRIGDLVPVAAGAAVAVLALTSTGSMVVAAAILGVATLDRRAAAAALLAVAAVAVRFSSTSFDDLAGIQSVLGDAVAVGPATAAASAALGALAVLLSVGPRAGVDWPFDVPAALAAGGFAAALAFGQGPGGDLWVRVVATVVASALALGIGLLDRRSGCRAVDARRWSAVVLGAVAVVLAAWP